MTTVPSFQNVQGNAHIIEIMLSIKRKYATKHKKVRDLKVEAYP